VTETKPRSGRWWRIAVAAFGLVLVALAGAAVVFLSLAADVVRDEVVMDILLLLLGVGVSALLPIAMVRVWLPRPGRTTQEVNEAA
jgi:hypothetical protein